MLSPYRKMSAFQTAQMFSLQDPNIFNIAIEGVFDDCQDIVKAVSNDLEYKARQKIGDGQFHQLGPCGRSGRLLFQGVPDGNDRQ